MPAKKGRMRIPAGGFVFAWLAKACPCAGIGTTVYFMMVNSDPHCAILCSLKYCDVVGIHMPGVAHK